MPRQRRRWPAGSAFAPNPTLVAVGKRCPALGGTSNSRLVKTPRAAYVLAVDSRGASAFPRLAIERRTCFSFRVEI